MAGLCVAWMPISGQGLVFRRDPRTHVHTRTYACPTPSSVHSRGSSHLVVLSHRIISYKHHPTTSLWVVLRFTPTRSMDAIDSSTNWSSQSPTPRRTHLKHPTSIHQQLQAMLRAAHTQQRLLLRRLLLRQPHGSGGSGGSWRRGLAFSSSSSPLLLAPRSRIRPRPGGTIEGRGGC